MVVSIPSQECADCRKKLAASLQSQKILEATNREEDCDTARFSRYLWPMCSFY